MKAVIATSIAPSELEKQKKAVSNWRAIGFDVISFNCQEETEQIRNEFPEVTFISVKRDGRLVAGKPLVYFDDILDYFRQSDCGLCGIVNSDIILEDAKELIPFLETETRNSLVTGCRVDIQKENSKEGVIYPLGLDYFFFDRSVIEAFPKDSFLIGSPWWDYWAAFVPLAHGITVKQLIPPIGYHPEHSYKWDQGLWFSLANRFYEYIYRNDIKLPLDQALIETHGLHFALAYGVMEYIHENARTISLNYSSSDKSSEKPFIDYNLLQRPPQEAETPEDFTRFKIMRKYLLKCIEKSPDFPGIVSTLNNISSFSRPQAHQVAETPVQKTAAKNNTLKFIETLSANPVHDRLADACVNCMGLIAHNAYCDDPAFAREEKAIKAMDKGEFSLLREFCTGGTDEGFLHYLYGLALEGKGLVEEALSEYQAALSQGLNTGRVIFLAASLAIKAGRIKTARDQFAVLYSMNPKSKEIADTLKRLSAEIERLRADVILSPLPVPENFCLPDSAPAVSLPKISLVLPTRVREKELEETLKSLSAAMQDVPYEVLLYIGGEMTDSLERLIGNYNIERIFFDRDIFRPSEKFSWAKIMNHGFKNAAGEWIMYASDDIMFHPYAFRNALTMIDDEEDLGGITFLHRNTVEDFGGRYRNFGYDSFDGKVFVNFGIIKKDAFLKTKGFDERLQFYWADVDICMQLWKKGFKIKASLLSLVDHNNLSDKRRSDNSGDIYHSDTKIYFQKWSGSRLFKNKNILARDRYFMEDSYVLKFLDIMHKHAAPEYAATIKPFLPVEKTVGQKLPSGVNISGYFNGEFGVAEIARGSVQAIQTTGIPFILNNIVAPGHRHNDLRFQDFSDDNPYFFNLIHVNADQAKAFRDLKGEHYFRNKYNIGVWFWELENFPEKWISSFQYYDEIWAKSEFCRKSFAKVSPVPVSRIKSPVIIYDKQIHPNRPKFNLSDDEYVFLFLFDYLSVFERKNPIGTIAAFGKAFSNRDNVRLLIKSINSHRAPDKVDLLHSIADGSRISFIDMHLDPPDMISLFASADCFVSLHRSEGLGLGLAQSMYLGKPCIATAYSGNMDFMTHENSFLVDYKLVELKDDHGPYEKGNVWADPDVDQAAGFMRLIYENRELAVQKGRQASVDIKRDLSAEAVGAEMSKRIHEIYEGRGKTSHAASKVSIVIPTYNNLRLTQGCIEAVRRTTGGIPYEMIVVDNGSDDGTSDYLRQEQSAGRLRAIVNTSNLGFAKACNQGAKAARSKYLLFLNNDTIPQSGWLEEMVKTAESDENIGIVGSKMLFPDGTIQHAGVVVPSNKLPYHIYRGMPGDAACANKQRDFQIVTAACMLIKRDLFFDAGGFDERFINGCEDIDLCLKAGLRNKRVVYNPGSVLIHYEAQSKGREDRMDFNRQLFLSIWKDRIQRDDIKFLREDGMDLRIGPDGAFIFMPSEKGISLDSPIPPKKRRASTPENDGLQTLNVKPSLSVIIVTFNSALTIRACLDSVLKYTPDAEVVVVDNASADGTAAILKEYSDLITDTADFSQKVSSESHSGLDPESGRPENLDSRLRTAGMTKKIRSSISLILNDANKGFSFACNQGIKVSKGEYVILLNPDTVVTPSWAQRMLAHFSPGVGAVGPVSSYVAALQKVELYAREPFGTSITINDIAAKVYGWNKGRGIDTKLLIGFCIMLPRRVLDETGMLDEDLFLGNDDLELSWRLKNSGYRLIIATDTFVYHEGQMSFRSEDSDKTTRLVQESTDRLYEKLAAYYGKGKIPTPRQLWGIDWFRPTHAEFMPSEPAGVVRPPEDASASMQFAEETYGTVTKPVKDTIPGLTSIIILAHNCWEHTRRCLKSIERNTPESHEIVIVDNGSADETRERLRELVMKPVNIPPSPLPSPARGEGIVSGPSSLGGEGIVSGPSSLGGEGIIPGPSSLGGEGIVSGPSSLGGEGIMSGPPSLGGEGIIPGPSSLGGEGIIPGPSSLGGEGIIPGPSSLGGEGIMSAPSPTGKKHKGPSPPSTGGDKGEGVISASGLRVIHNTTNRGYAAGNNQGISIARGDYIVLLNNDTIVTPGWLGRLKGVFKSYPKTGIAGPMSNHVTRPQLADNVGYKGRGGIEDFARQWARDHEGQSFSTTKASGFCLFVKREVVDAIGGLDEQFGSGNFEDDDFCSRALLAGFDIRIAQDVFIHHEGGQTFKAAGIDHDAKMARNWKMYKAKWGIPEDTPLERYWVPSDLPDNVSLYVPLPDLQSGHAADLENRWWEDTGQKDKRRPQPAARERYQVDDRSRGEVDAKERSCGLTSIILIISNQLEYTQKCAESIIKHTPEPHEIIFLDIGSSHNTSKWVRKLVKRNPLYRFVESNSTAGYSSACNRGIAGSSGEFIVLLKDSTIVTKGWLTGMRECLDSMPGAGIAGPMTVNVEGRQQIRSAENEPVDDPDNFAEIFREKNRYRRALADNLDGFCMLFRYDLLEKIGLFDERFGLDIFADPDFCLRAALDGFRNIISADVYIHNSKTSAGSRVSYSSSFEKDKKILVDKWRDIDKSSLLWKKFIALNALNVSDELFQKGQPESAEANLREALRHSPGDIRLHLALADLLILNKKSGEAMEIILNMPEEMRSDLRSLELAALCKESMNLYEDAEKYADEALFLDNSSARAWNMKGVNAFRKGLNADAEGFFNKAIESDMGFGEPYSNLGALKWNAGNKEDALKLFETGFILSPTLEDVVTNYYRAAVSLSLLARAEKVFKEAISLYPNNRRLKFVLMDNLLQQNKFNEAMDLMEESMAVTGVDDDALSVGLALRDKVGVKEVDKLSTGSISLCMIVKNEENNLVKCLTSVKTVVDEIIVVDTGSHDRTKDIAKVFGAKVYDFEWTNNFSDARNYSLSKASGRWILVLDADEVIASSDLYSIRKLVKKTGSKPVAYDFTSRNYVMPVNTVGWTAHDGKYRDLEAGTGWFPSNKVRLFPNSERIKFEKPIHELVEPSLIKLGFKIRKSEIPVHHYGKLNAEKVTDKGRDYYALQERALSVDDGKNIVAIAEMARQSAEIGLHEKALEYWGEAIALKPDLPEAHYGMGYSYFHLERYDEACISLKKAMELAPDSRDNILLYSSCEIYTGHAENAIACLKKVLEKEPLHPVAISNLAMAYICSGRKDEGSECIKKMKEMNVGFEKLFTDCSGIVMSAQNYQYAISLLGAVNDHGKASSESSALLAECYSKRQLNA